MDKLANMAQPVLDSNLGQLLLSIGKVATGTYARAVAITAVCVATLKLAEASSNALAYVPKAGPFLEKNSSFKLTKAAFDTTDRFSKAAVSFVARKAFRADADAQSGRINNDETRARVEKIASGIQLALAVVVVSLGAKRLFQFGEAVSSGLGSWNGFFEAANFPVRFVA